MVRRDMPSQIFLPEISVVSDWRPSKHLIVIIDSNQNVMGIEVVKLF